MNRRHFLQYLSAITGCSMLFRNNTNALANVYTEKNTYISAAKSSTGQFSIQTLNSTGKVIQSFEIPQRGHSFAVNQSDTNHVLAIGRRPANYFFAINFSTPGSEPQQVKAPKNRRYYGHAAFNTSGSLVYLTENNLETGQGVIGIYDVQQGFQRVGEFSSYGIGPHDIFFDSQYQCLVVANGGIRTHPSSGRKKLNLSTMCSSLTFINAITGEMLKTISLNEKFRFNSIRHVVLDSQSNVYVSLQNQKKGSQQTLLAIYNNQKNALITCDIPQNILPQLNRYIGDITLDCSESIFAATSPRGNTILIYNTQGVFLTSYSLEDVCGVSKTGMTNEFMLTTGKGDILKLRYNPSNSPCISIEKRKYFYPNLAWDNHLIRL